MEFADSAASAQATWGMPRSLTGEVLVGESLDIDDPVREHRFVKNHATIDFESATVEISVRQCIAPSLEELSDKTRNFSSCKTFLDSQVTIDFIQSDISGNSDLDDSCLTIIPKEFHSVIAEERVRYMTVKIRPVGQVLIEAVTQSVTRERQMNLPLSIPGFVSHSLVEHGQVKLLFLPLRMARKRSAKALSASRCLQRQQAQGPNRFHLRIGQTRSMKTRDHRPPNPLKRSLDDPLPACAAKEQA